jgi:hypothetical protein
VVGDPVTHEVVIAVTSVLLLAAVWILRLLEDRLHDTRVPPLIGLAITIVGGAVLVWTMLGIAAHELP